MKRSFTSSSIVTSILSPSGGTATWPLQTEEFAIRRSDPPQLRSRPPSHSRGSICSKYFSFAPRCSAARSEETPSPAASFSGGGGNKSQSDAQKTSGFGLCDCCESSPLPPPPPPPSSPPAVGVRSHIAVAASLFFSLSLSPAASICIFPLSPSGRYTSGRRHLAASCLAHTPARRCDFFSRGQGEVMFALVTFRKPAVSACQGATPGDFGVRGAVSSISRGPFPRPCVLSTSSCRRGDA